MFSKCSITKIAKLYWGYQNRCIYVEKKILIALVGLELSQKRNVDTRTENRATEEI